MAGVEIDTLLWILLLWALVTARTSTVDLRKYGIQVYPFLINWKTKRLNSLINRLAFRFSGIWRKLWAVGVVISLCAMVYAICFLVENLLATLRAKPIAVVTPIIPGVTITGIYIFYALFGVAVTVIAHEFAHGIAACSEGTRIKSAGVFVAGIIFGAFIELDEKEVRTLSPRKKINIFSAGSASNVVVAFLFLALILSFPVILFPLYNFSPSGVAIVNVVENGPAYSAGIRPGDVIFSINGTPIRSVEDLEDFLKASSPNQTVIVETSRGRFVVRLGRCPWNSSRGYLGVRVFNYYEARLPLVDSILGPLFPYHVFETLRWTFMISFSVGLLNMLPIPPLDGDKVLVTIMEILNVKRSSLKNTIRACFAIFSSSLLLLNIIVTFLSFGITVLP